MRRLLATLALSALSHTQAAEEDLKISRAGSRPVAGAPAQTFAGAVKVEMLHQPAGPDRAMADVVSFVPGARTAWHTRPLGQTQVVTAGVGRVQRCRGDSRRRCRAGALERQALARCCAKQCDDPHRHDRGPGRLDRRVAGAGERCGAAAALTAPGAAPASAQAQTPRLEAGGRPDAQAGLPSASAALQFVDGLGHQDRACGADRVTQRDARPNGVDLGRFQIRHARHGRGLPPRTSRGLDQVKRGHAQIGALQGQAGGRHRAQAADPGMTVADDALLASSVSFSRCTASALASTRATTPSLISGSRCSPSM